MYRMRPFVPDHILVNLYYSLVYPYIIYCNVVWGGTCNTYIEGLRVLQKKIIRIITNSEYLAHTNQLFYITKILKIDDVRTYTLATYAFNNISSFGCHAHVHVTRNRNRLLPAYQRLSQTQRSVSFSVPNVWNSLPLNIRQSQSLSTFKYMLKQHLVDSYRPADP